MPGLLYVPSMLVVGLSLGAMVVYIVLRWVSHDPATGTSAASLSNHALWVGIIGWVASSLQGAMNLGIIPANPSAAPYPRVTEAVVLALAWPVLGCLAVHAVGQLSYPGPQQARRRTVLSVLRIRDFLPRRLALVTGGIFVAAGALIAVVAMLPGFDAVPAVTVNDGAVPLLLGGRDGRIPGLELAAWLGAALVVLAGGTVLVLLLIAGRRQLEALDAADNATLRSIAMNRLLRTVATIAAGLGVIAGNYATHPDPAAVSTGWVNPAGLAGMAVLLVMFCWRPPTLAASLLGPDNRPVEGLRSGQHPAARLLSSLGPLHAAAAGLPLVVGAFVLSGPAAETFELGWAVFATVAAVASSAVLAAGELVLRHNYGDAGVPRSQPRRTVGPAMLTTAVLALVAFLLALAITAIGQSSLGGAADWLPIAGLAAVGAAASLPVALLARFRRSVPNGPDAALRAVTVHRAVRTLSSLLAALTAALLMTQTPAWAAVFAPAGTGVPFGYSVGEWWPASLAGGVFVAAAIVIAIVPVRLPHRGFVRPTPQPAA